jgi:hypothetical protein
MTLVGWAARKDTLAGARADDLYLSFFNQDKAIGNLSSFNHRLPLLIKAFLANFSEHDDMVWAKRCSLGLLKIECNRFNEMRALVVVRLNFILCKTTCRTPD